MSYRILSSETILQPKQHAMVREILNLSAIFRALPKNSHVVTDNLPQSIVGRFIEAAGLSSDVVITESLLLHYGFNLVDMFDSADLSFTCIAANASELLLTPPVEAGFSGLARQPKRFKLQTIDELCCGLKRLDWLALGYVDFSLLNAASHCIHNYRPLISLYFDGSLTSLKKWCEEYGYVVLDTEVNKSSDNTGFKRQIFLLPSDTLLKNILLLLKPVEKVLSDVPITKNNIIHLLPSLFLEEDKLALLTKQYIIDSRKEYNVSSMLSTNLFPVENNRKLEWRWTGPGHNTTILLPLYTRGIYKFSLTVLALPEGIEKNYVRCFINGKIVMNGIITDGTVINFEYLVDKPELPVELNLSVTDINNCYSRNLGIAISSIEVAWDS